MDAQHTKHVTYKLAYHFVWCPKYRKKILVGKLATFLEQEIRRICEANTWTIGALNVQVDLCIFFSVLPRPLLPHKSLIHSKAPPPIKSFCTKAQIHIFSQSGR
jgi:putative transposase